MLKGRLDRIRQSSTALFINVGLLVLSTVLLVSVSAYPRMARVFPQLILILLIGLTSLDILVIISEKSEAKAEKDRQEIEEGAREKRRFLYTIALMFIFLFSMLVFGFTVGTFIFLLFAPWSLGYKNKRGLVAFCVMTTGLMYIIFILIMNSFLPEGLILDMLRR